MSLIRLFATGRLSPSALSELRTATGRSAIDLVKSAEANAPVAEFTLFKKDHDEVATRVRALLANVPEGELRALECVADRESGQERCHETSFQVIRNVLDEAEQISRDLDATE